MKTIAFICPYFGKLPKDHIELWIKTCEYNPTIDWYIYTDDCTNYEYPDNVKVKNISFEQMKEKIQKKFDFQISLENPYKLCDYKPAYGYIFEEDISAYDYWGYCDMSDTFFGNLRLFLSDEIICQADKTLFWGHMSIYRNDYDVNRRFMLGTESLTTYKEVFQNPENMCFDELHEYSIDSIYKYNGFGFNRIDEMYHDISPLFWWFRICEVDQEFVQSKLDNVYRVYLWENGILKEIRCEKKEQYVKEIGYIHFQKRKIKKKFTGNVKSFLIAPDGIYDAEKILLNTKWIKKHSKHKFIYKMYFYLRFKNLKYKIMHMCKF